MNNTNNIAKILQSFKNILEIIDDTYNNTNLLQLNDLFNVVNNYILNNH